MTIAAGIVTYEPDIDRLTQNLEAIRGQVSFVLIYDNGSSNRSSIERLLAGSSEIEVHYSDENDGIAAALNRLAERAFERGAEFILTLDQDSVCSSGMVGLLRSRVTDRVGMITPYVVDRNKMSLAEHAVTVLPAVERYSQPARRGAITSGALLPLRVWREVGGFDERYFIDYVDYDLNQRILAAGLDILRVNAATILHEVGRAEATWLRVPRKDISGKWKWERFYAFGHSATRCYYKARNRVLFTRKYGRQLGVSHEGVWQIPQQVILTILFERKRLAKLRSFARGIRDGIALDL